jgi:hypothetical protein
VTAARNASRRGGSTEGEFEHQGARFGSNGMRRPPESPAPQAESCFRYSVKPRRLNEDWFRAVFAPMPFWSVVRSLPAKERFAAEQLGLRGFEVFLPLVQTKRASQPLFASYFSAESWSNGGRSIRPLASSACCELAIAQPGAPTMRSTDSRP